ncbi:MAG: HEPN domain-containing protein [Tepidisphaeraceae bacterium]
MKWNEQRDLLLSKAAEDDSAMAILARTGGTSDAIIGFHAQQAVEKYLKALLCHLQVSYDRTHDLVVLLDALTDAGCAVPTEVDNCKYLQPYAVQFRYDDIPAGARNSLDRVRAQQDVEAAKRWVTRLIARGVHNP